MSRDSFNAGKFPDDAIERLRKIDDVSADFPPISLKEILAKHKQAPFGMAKNLAPLFRGESVPHADIIVLVDQVRAGLMEAIGKTWAYFKERDTPDRELLIEHFIKAGYEPLDAIYEYNVLLFTDAARQWEATTSTFDPMYANLLYNANLQQEGCTPADVIVRGATNGTDITLSVLEVLLSRWQYQYGTNMPKEELDKSLHFECVWPLLSVWRKMKGGEVVGTFEEDIYDDYSTMKTLASGSVRVVWNPEKAELMQTSKGIWIVLPSGTVIEDLHQRTFDVTAYPSRGYCPAASAYETPESVESVQMQAIKRVIALARKYWLPRYEE